MTSLRVRFSLPLSIIHNMGHAYQGCIHFWEEVEIASYMYEALNHAIAIISTGNALPIIQDPYNCMKITNMLYQSFTMLIFIDLLC